MKYRIFSLLLVCILSFSVIPFPSFATEVTVSEEIITLKDGSYIEITLTEIGSRASGTTTGQKSYNYKSSNGTFLWQAVLSGSFTYNGTSATCTSASCTVTTYDDSWYEDSNTTTRSGNKATTELTMGHTFLFITISKDSCTITLSCDKDGKLS